MRHPISASQVKGAIREPFGQRDVPAQSRFERIVFEPLDVQRRALSKAAVARTLSLDHNRLDAFT